MKARIRLMLCSALSGAAAVLAAAAFVNSQPATAAGESRLTEHPTRFVPAARASFGSGSKATGGGHILKEGGNEGVHFGFNAQVQNKGRLHGSGVVQDHDTGDRIKILTVESYVSDGMSATFTGQCEFNGVPQQYEIEVSDIDEPGTGVDTFQITTGTYARGGILTGGNIQVQGAAVVNPTPTPTATPTPSPTPDSPATPTPTVTPTPTPIPDSPTPPKKNKPKKRGGSA